jgi:hypothetical protein
VHSEKTRLDETARVIQNAMGQLRVLQSKVEQVFK